MSIVAFDVNDINRSKISIPIATENFFYSYWKPPINFLNLKYLSQIEYGMDIHISNIKVFLNELKVLEDWIKVNYNVNVSEIIIERIQLLRKTLIKAFKDNSKTIIYIG